MRTVMIVDDEPLTRYALRKLISQNFEDLQVIEEAENGLDAQEIAIRKQPDLIFMDIKMPGQSGIEASEKILEACPQIHIIILTAYDHFDYIQKALEIGVEGYLLKPISKDIVVKKINDIIKRIGLIEAKAEARKALEKNMDAVVGLAERDFIDQIIQNSYDEEVSNEYLQFLGYRITYGYFMCLSFEETSGQFFNSTIIRERNRIKVTTAIDRYLPFMTKYIQASPRGNCIILFLYDTDSTEGGQYHESQMIAEHLLHKINLVEGIPLKAGIGSACQKPEDYRRSFSEAYRMLDKASMLEVKHIEDVNSYHQNIAYAYPVSSIEELKEKMRLGSMEESEKLSQAIVDDILLSSMPMDRIKEYLVQYYFDIRRLMVMSSDKDAGYDSQRVMGIRHVMDSDEVRNILLTEISQIIEQICHHASEGDQILTKRIYDFIHGSYKENITLDDLAKEIGKTSQYTSKLFKDMFDINFVEYLSNLRIDEAKRLLKETNYRVKEIASLAGYEDANYFCRIFKRKLGVTPKEFRKMQ